MITLEEFQHKYCDACGTQRCAGIRDMQMREGCGYYQKEILGKEKSDQEKLQETLTLAGKILNLASFIAANFHHCPFPENCGINWETECTGWGSSNCTGCLAKYSDKLNTKEN